MPLAETHPSTLFWAGPAILVSAIAIAWAAESVQFFIAPGFALAILAWLQTLPEFAVEAVLAWHQQVQYLLANLTGALQLLTGFGWPVSSTALNVMKTVVGRDSNVPMLCLHECSETPYVFRLFRLYPLECGSAWWWPSQFRWVVRDYSISLKKKLVGGVRTSALGDIENAFSFVGGVGMNIKLAAHYTDGWFSTVDHKALGKRYLLPQ
ncbi:MAG: hypothetical protein ACRD4E_05705 [Bryobacteraceae bacterium]